MNLEFVTSRELIQELLRRYDHAVVAVLRVGERGPSKESYERLWKGNPHTAAGLCADLQFDILQQLRMLESEVGPPDLGGASGA